MVKAKEEQHATKEIEDLPEVQDKEAATEEPAPAEAPTEEPAEAAEEIVEERIYTIPLQKALIRPPKKRAPRAMQMIKIFITKHMKLAVTVSEDEEEEELPQLIVSQEVNEKIWDRGIEKPPRKIRVRAAKDKDGNVTVYLAETAE
jgi:large subunit ribosomal protein L31e